LVAGFETGRQIGWGIIGTGHIANDFASDLKLLKDSRLVAVLSRDQSTANRFAAKQGATSSYFDMDRFLADKGIDVVYIASPNSSHLPQALKVIRAGKAVLVEKPLAPSVPEAEVLAREAERNGVFAMEAMWIRFLPGIAKVKAVVEAGEIGTIRLIRGTLGWKNEYDPKNRLFSKALGGGASLDLGVYLLSLTMHLMGEPKQISGSWKAAPSGVDWHAFYRLHYDHAVAELECGLDGKLANTIEIVGDKGIVRISDPFIRAGRIEIANGWLGRWLMSVTDARLPAKVMSRLSFPGHRALNFTYKGHGLSFQAEAVAQALRQGRTGHASMPLEESAAVLHAISMVMATAPAE
jgi:predicted dehydrogenase